jgi:hypothetical protein
MIHMTHTSVFTPIASIATKLLLPHALVTKALPLWYDRRTCIICIIYIGVVSVYIKYNCVNYCDTLCLL